MSRRTWIKRRRYSESVRHLHRRKRCRLPLDDMATTVRELHDTKGSGGVCDGSDAVFV